MARISDLALLAPLGTDRVPVGRGLSTPAVTVQSLIDAGAAAASGEADRAETARDVALTAGPYFPSIAAGEAATAAGLTFYVAPGDGSISARRRTAGGSVPVFAYPTVAAMSGNDGWGNIGTPNGTMADAMGRIRRDMKSLTEFALPGQPIGVGNADWDTAALKAMLAAQMATRRYYGTSFGGQYRVFGGFIPPVDLLINEPLGANLQALNIECVERTATITALGDFHVFEIPNRLDSTNLRGITSIGGRGLLLHSHTGINVAGEHNIVGVTALDYDRGTAIDLRASDMPYVAVRAIVRAKSGALGYTRGYAQRGLIDQGQYTLWCENNNNGHMHLGPMRSGNCVLDNCWFGLFETGVPNPFDLWIEPNDTIGGFGTNGGSISYSNAKHGNEGRTAASHDALELILIAARGATGSAGATPDRTWKNGADGAHYMSGFNMRRCAFYGFSHGGGDGVHAPIVKSCIQNIAAFDWDESNTVQGGRFDYLMEFADGGAWKPSYVNTSSIVRLGGDVDMAGFGSAFRKGVSNRPFATIVDARGIDASPMRELEIRDPLMTTVAGDGGGANYLAEAGVAIAAAADRRGAGTARKGVWTTPGRYVYVQLDTLAGRTGNDKSPFRLIAEYWGGANQGDEIEVRLYNFTDFQIAKLGCYPISAEHRFIRTRFPIPPSANPADWVIGFALKSVVPGAKDACTFGEFKLVQGQSWPEFG